MTPRTRILLAFLLVPLGVLAAFLKYQARQQRIEGVPRRMEHQRISGMREDPLSHVHSGMTVAEVNRALGPGERFRAKGRDLIVWTGTGHGQSWTLTAVVEGDRLSDVSMTRGTADKHMAMELRGAFDEPRPDESETMAKIPGDDQEAIVSLISALGGSVQVDEKIPGKPVIGVSLGRTVLGGSVGFRGRFDRTPEVTGPALGRLKELTHLQSLSLAGSEVTDAGLAHVKGLTRLTTLNLSHTKISDVGLEHLKTLEKLSHLYLDKTLVAGPGLAHLKDLTSLRQLTLSGGRLSDDGLQHLVALHGLENLTLSGPQFTDEGLEHLAALANLQQLNLSCQNVRGNGLAHLANLPRLERLDLRGTLLSDAGAEGLEGLTRLTSLSLSNLNDQFMAMFVGGSREPVTVKVRITDVGMPHLAGLKNLRSLNLGGTLITEAGLVHLECLTNLETLNLAHTQVRETGLKHLAGLTNLNHLHLEGTPIRDAGLEHLRGLTHLEWLDLDNTQVTNAGLEHLTGLTNLKYLGLKGTQVTDEGRRKLQQALPNCGVF